MRLHLNLAIVGIVLVLFAFVAAGAIPRKAMRDYDVAVEKNHLGQHRTAQTPDTFHRMSANRRLLQTGLVGSAGLVLFAVGVAGASRIKLREEEREHEDNAIVVPKVGEKK